MQGFVVGEIAALILLYNTLLAQYERCKSDYPPYYYQNILDTIQVIMLSVLQGPYRLYGGSIACYLLIRISWTDTEMYYYASYI